MTRVRCRKCNTIIESKGHRHNFVECSCEDVHYRAFVDGGDEYARVGGLPEYTDIWNEERQEWVPAFGEETLNATKETKG